MMRDHQFTTTRLFAALNRTRSHFVEAHNRSCHLSLSKIGDTGIRSAMSGSRQTPLTILMFLVRMNSPWVLAGIIEQTLALG